MLRKSLYRRALGNADTTRPPARRRHRTARRHWPHSAHVSQCRRLPCPPRRCPRDSRAHSEARYPAPPSTCRGTIVNPIAREPAAQKGTPGAIGSREPAFCPFCVFEESPSVGLMRSWFWLGGCSRLHDADATDSPQWSPRQARHFLRQSMVPARVSPSRRPVLGSWSPQRAPPCGRRGGPRSHGCVANVFHAIRLPACSLP